MPASLIRIGSRGSKLALTQTRSVIESLEGKHPNLGFEIVVITTKGDQPSGEKPLGDGIFVKEIQRALLEGRVDAAVHSLKDVPTDPAPGVVVAAIPVRADPREAMVGSTLERLAPGARIGTGSPRRAAQLKRLRPDLVIQAISGNIDTRIAKVAAGEVDAIVVAAAGLSRLGLEPDQWLELDQMLPAPGQGALSIEVKDGTEFFDVFSTIHDAPTRDAVVAERAVLRELGGGCLLPVAAYAHLDDHGLNLVASVTSADGTKRVDASAVVAADKPLAAAKRVSSRLISQGARDLF